MMRLCCRWLVATLGIVNANLYPMTTDGPMSAVMNLSVARSVYVDNQDKRSKTDRRKKLNGDMALIFMAKILEVKPMSSFLGCSVFGVLTRGYKWGKHIESG